jgi:uncharacterized protein (TIGR02001 family)
MRIAMHRRAQRWISGGAAFLYSALLFSPSYAADVTGYIVLTTDYVFRGVTYSDGHAAAQAGADIALDSGLYFGMWGSSVDISGNESRHRDLQLNYYLGYSRDLQNSWSIGANVVAYTFPGTEGDVDYDYLEYSMVTNYDDRIWLEYSYSPDLFHSSRYSHNLDLYTEWPLTAGLMLGAGAGYYEVSDLTGSGYGYWQLGLTRSFGRFDIDLRYHDSNRAVPIISTVERAKARLALSAKLLF